jgi:hypothetical protein
MWYKNSNGNTLLSAVTATGAGSTIDLGLRTLDVIRWWILASAVTTGGTVKIQVSNDGTNWADAATQAVAANGLLTGTVSGPFRYIRGNLTARTDGTYTVKSDHVWKP